jgi:large subunit ribosomal protein L21
MFAVIRTGGKQYIVSPGDKIKIEKIAGKEGKEVSFSDVLLVDKQNKLEIGQPKVKGAKVAAKILKQDRSKKVTILKYKPKVRYKVKKGHRQPFTQVEITKIEH